MKKGTKLLSAALAGLLAVSVVATGCVKKTESVSTGVTANATVTANVKDAHKCSGKDGCATKTKTTVKK